MVGTGEPLRRNADYREHSVVHPEGAANDARVTPESARPVFVGKDRVAWLAARPVVILGKQSACRWAQFECREHPTGDVLAIHPLDLIIGLVSEFGAI
jgi:hypothetical protein